MNNINFLGQPDYPLACQDVDMIQEMITLSAMLSYLGGDKYILRGCADNDGIVDDGIVVISGTPYRFAGGQKREKVTVVETKIDRMEFGKTYPEARITRIVTFSDVGAYNWSDFVQVLSNRQLEDKYNSIKGEPVGVMYMWPGTTSTIPDKYLSCDGSEMLIDDYPELYDVIGTSYGGNGTTNFRLPDLRGRFVAGYDNSRNDYNAMGETGGEEKHTLTIEEMPPHSHEYERHAIGSIDLGRYSFASNHDNAVNDKFNTTSVGGGAGHENRPPYIVLGYIIKVKP